MADVPSCSELPICKILLLFLHTADWVSLATGSYHFGTAYVTWKEGRQFCNERGGYLAEIERYDEENNAIIEYLNAQNLLRDFWIGLKLEDGKWIWNNSGSDTAHRYTNWGTGEPNNAGNNEGCAEILYRYNWRWNDSNCERKIHVICEK